ncbi:MAG TPA: protoporphyrinogen oxidase [Oligoflexia bacterium]|nr:protoporphyrinogen oxidase [Oligoflexia bacterium]HMP27261.1 protoporphyrinogen oxidase [Oligoflexia bacterium]
MGEKEFETAIIGGGITGLALKWFLAKANRSALVIDENWLGGTLRSVNYDQFTLELGPQTIALTPLIKDFFFEIGVKADQIITARSSELKAYVVHGNQAYATPRTPKQLLFSDLFSLKQKLRIFYGLIKKNYLLRDQNAFCSFAEIFGEDCARLLVAPLLRGIFAGNLEDLNLAAIFPELYQHLNKGGAVLGYLRAKKNIGKRVICSLKGGNHQLIRTLLSGIDQKNCLKASVVKVCPLKNAGFEIYLSDQSIARARNVVIAVASDKANSFLGELAPPPLAELKRMPLMVTHFAYDTFRENLPEDCFGYLFKEQESRALIGMMFNHNIFEGVAPQSKGLITATSNVCDTAIVANEIKSFLKIKELFLLNRHVWDDGLPLYSSEYFERLRIVKEIENLYKGLFFAGNDLYGVSIPRRIEVAREIVDKLL